jgi:hypothetical protein
MTLGALKWSLLALVLALPLAACSQAEPPVPEFQTVTVDLREPATRLASAGGSVPLPVRKPVDVAAVPEGERAAAAGAPSKPEGFAVASTRYLRRLLPDFNQITACPNGITCTAAFAN